MHATDFNTVLAVIIAAVFGPWFAWFAIKGLREGKTGPKKLPATRTENPILFWIYVAMYGAVSTMFVAFAVFSLNYQPDMSSSIEVASVVISILCFGGAMASIAGVTGFYTAQGFRTGTAALIWQGSVDFYDRDEHTGWYWATQIQNLVMVVFLGTIGVGAMAIALWFVCGAPPLW
jgi:hypothetical protein